MEDLVSVIVPIYFVEKFLDKCLKSISEQTYKNIEVFMVDDENSTDKSGEIALKYASCDKRFVYLKQPHGTLGDARDYALPYTNGKYVVFVDSDDFVHKDYVKVLHHTISSTEADIAICKYSKVKEKNFFKTNYSSKINENKKIKIFDKVETLKRFFLVNTFSSCVWDKIYRREIIAETRFGHISYAEDLPFNFAYFNKINKCAFVEIPLYYWTRRQGSLTTAKFAEKRLEVFYSLNKIIEYCKQQLPYLTIFPEVWFCCQAFEAVHSMLKSDYKNLDVINFVFDSAKDKWQSLKKCKELDFARKHFMYPLYKIMIKKLLRNVKHLPQNVTY